MLALANGIAPVRAAAWLRRSLGGGDDPGTKRDVLGGVNEARHLLERWSRQRVQQLIRGVEVSAEYYVTKDGAIELGAHYSDGSIRQLVALSMGEVRAALGQAYDRHVKQCDSPRCRKWFFDDGAGIQKHCCAKCGNAHQQLKLSPEYKRRRAKGDYTSEPCCRC